MAEQFVVEVETRTKTGSRESLRLRKRGMIPGIIYGHKETPEPIAVSNEAITNALRQHSRTLTLSTNGKKQDVLIQEMQYDHLGKEILHIDFLRASATDVIRITVPVELRGDAPGLRTGGVLIQPLHNLHIECTVASRPEAIRVRVDELQMNQAIHVRELTIPAGVKVLENPEAVVVQIKLPSAEPTISPVEGAVEPEVITKKKEKEETEE